MKEYYVYELWNPMYGKSAVKGRRWYHNGINQYYLYEADDKIISLNLIRGRLIRSSSSF